MNRETLQMKVDFGKCKTPAGVLLMAALTKVVFGMLARFCFSFWKYVGMGSIKTFLWFLYLSRWTRNGSFGLSIVLAPICTKPTHLLSIKWPRLEDGNTQA